MSSHVVIGNTDWLHMERRQTELPSLVRSSLVQLVLYLLHTYQLPSLGVRRLLDLNPSDPELSPPVLRPTYGTASHGRVRRL